jgi:NAD(P)-dependent dehydrogenase (short-subunit alcohol dehydrogenase family)
LTAFALDVTDEASTARAADEAARLYGGVDVLVNGDCADVCRV